MGIESGAEANGLLVYYLVMAPFCFLALLVIIIAIQAFFIAKKINLKKQLIYSPFLIFGSQFLKLVFTGELQIQLLDCIFLTGLILAILLLPITKCFIKPTKEKGIHKEPN